MKLKYFISQPQQMETANPTFLTLSVSLDKESAKNVLNSTLECIIIFILLVFHFLGFSSSFLSSLGFLHNPPKNRSQFYHPICMLYSNTRFKY
jgi:hypothetical protein